MKMRLLLLALCCAMSACVPKNDERPTAEVGELSKFDQAFDEYATCALIAFGDARSQSFEQGTPFDRDAAVDQSLRKCKPEGKAAASILIREEATDIPYKYRLRSANINNRAVPVVEQAVRDILDGVS